LEPVTGHKKALLYLKELSQNLYDGVKAVIKRESNLSRNNILRAMRETPKSSKASKRGNVIHHPSLPGNAPAIDTGELAGDIIVMDEGDITQFGAHDNKYAERLEDKNKSNRPFVEPEFKNIVPRLEDGFKKLGI